MRLLSWNLNGRTTCIAEQMATVAARRPDIVALQEVTTRTSAALARALAEAGLPHATDSFKLAPSDLMPRGPRRYGQLLASRHPLEPIPPGRFTVPWPERVLSALALAPTGRSRFIRLTFHQAAATGGSRSRC